MAHKASEFYRDDLTAHDPLCSWPDQYILKITCPECTMIVRVRADERERIARAIESVAFETFVASDGYKSIAVHEEHEGLTLAVKIARGETA